MMQLQKLPNELSRMILGYLVAEEDKFSAAAAHPTFASLLLQHHQLTPVAWCRYFIWGKGPIAQKVDKSAAPRALSVIDHASTVAIEEEIDFEAEIFFHPKFAGQELLHDSLEVKGTLLHLAAYSGLREVVEFALEQSADKNAVLECHQCGLSTNDMEKTTPLYLAASREHWAVVYRLIEAGARVGEGIHWAIQYESPQILGRILSAQPQPLSKEDLIVPFDYIGTRWYAYREPETETKNSTVALASVMLGRGVYNAIRDGDGDEDQVGDTKQYFELALKRDDDQMALLLAQVGFASDFDINENIEGFVRDCLWSFRGQREGFANLLAILRVFMEKQSVNGAEFIASIDRWGTQTEEQIWRAKELGKTLESHGRTEASNS
ncbi:ankyrin repeat domain protein [Colletotrichum chrysophilum]|uniref:Ankyrin repeat domain protein n=1 Tax=Colletotrichum chrysophilum TaxID=1836956 RepID=A0AAD8ZXR7_9PEZI|nr:ankyrin repeat domain protein [Colletotrichum chrysophilum]